MSWTVPDAIAVHGTGGTLTVGYQVAAEVGAWTVTTWPVGADERRCRVEATLARIDPFWIREATTFGLTLSRGNWTWRWREVPAPLQGSDRLMADGLPQPERR